MAKRPRPTSIVARLQEIVSASPADLARAWLDLVGKPAPRLPAELLTRALCYEVQSRAMCALPARIAKQLRASRGTAAPPKAPVPKAADTLAAGSTLVRSWGGTTYTVHVDDGGYLLNGRRYSSLSQIATEITGTRWSGPRFFGLKAAGAASNA